MGVPVVLLRPPPIWPGRCPEQILDAPAPLIGEGLAVDDHEG
jgi:hypothetical protein